MGNVERRSIQLPAYCPPMRIVDDLTPPGSLWRLQSCDYGVLPCAVTEIVGRPSMPPATTRFAVSLGRNTLGQRCLSHASLVNRYCTCSPVQNLLFATVHNCAIHLKRKLWRTAIINPGVAFVPHRSISTGVLKPWAIATSLVMPNDFLFPQRAVNKCGVATPHAEAMTNDESAGRKHLGMSTFEPHTTS